MGGISVLRKREIPMAIIFIISMIFVVQYYVKGVEPLDTLTNTLGNWAIIFSALAMGIGLINLIIIHGRKVMDRKGEWYFDAWLILIMLVTFGLGAIGGTEDPYYSFIFNNVYQALSPTLFSFAYLYMCTIAVQAFRVMNWDAGLLMLAGVLTMIANIPMVQVQTGLFVELKNWIFAVPARGVFTAFRISLALGFVLIGIRVILGVERGYLGVEEA
ncbi:MAG: hypothetical protein NDF54_00615 [archaeon GB-1867-035]|nr:hypothetical protein [Candidatus Culexmicrobium profundum]